MSKKHDGAEPTAAVADTSAQDASARRDGVDELTRAASPSPSNARLTADQWAEVYFPASATGRIHDERWKHAAASQLHGWGNHLIHTGSSVELTQADYEAALAAASGTELIPHPAADCRRKG